VETLAGQIVGDELFMRVSTQGVTGVYPFQWMWGVRSLHAL
jgi:hypothetical protein